MNEYPLLAKVIHEAELETKNNASLSSIGGFSALFGAPEGYEDPVFSVGVDGVGTKIAHTLPSIAGWDCVAMCANDIVTNGSQPIAFLNYLAHNSVPDGRLANVMRGIKEACEYARMAIIGGETASLNRLLCHGDYDVAGTAIGVIERSSIIDGSTIAEGDFLVGISSNGLHSNGFTLYRKIMGESAYYTDKTRIYSPLVFHLLRRNVVIKGMAHITGGGIPGNVPRMIPNGELRADIDWYSWEVPQIFSEIQQEADSKFMELSDQTMFETFNMGIGFVLTLGGRDALKAVKLIENYPGDFKAWIIGRIVRA